MRMPYRENHLLKIREVIMTFLGFSVTEIWQYLDSKFYHNVLYSLPQNVYKMLYGYILTDTYL